MTKPMTHKEVMAKIDQVQYVIAPRLCDDDEAFIMKFIFDLTEHYQFKGEK